MKGQVAFESLFIVLVVLSAAIFITTLYLNTNETTVSAAIIRDELFSQTLDMNTNVLLTYLHIEKNNGVGIPTIEVTTDPNTIRSADFNWTLVKNKLSKVTTLSNFWTNVNGIIDNNPK